MATHRRYTKAQKAEAVGIAVLEGQRGAADITGIPVTTIHEWMEHPDFVQLRTEKREAVEQMFWAGIQVGLKAVIEGLQGPAKLGEKSVALGILYDKHALLTGGATGRTESRDLSSRSDHERALLSDVIDAELARRLADPEPPEDGAGTGEAGPLPEVPG